MDIFNQLEHKSIFSAANHFGGAKSAEQIAQIDSNIKAGKTAEIITGSGSGNKLYFDGAAGTVSASISDEAFARLKEHFDESDFHKRDDGSYILSGEAERFVSGWYDDVANARGYAAANMQGKAELDLAELYQIKNTFTAHASTQQIDSYQSGAQIGLDATSVRTYTPKNIDAALSESILKDKDANGVIDFSEEINAKAATALGEQNGANPMSELMQSAKKAVEDMMSELLRAQRKSGLDAINEGASNEQKAYKKALEIAQALGQLARIRSAVNEGKTLSVDDTKMLELLKITPESLKKTSENKVQETLASTLHISEQKAASKADEMAKLGSELASEFANKDHLLDKLI